MSPRLSSLVVGTCLAAVFLAAFLTTTWLTDAYCRHNGYYTPGLMDDFDAEREYQVR